MVKTESFIKINDVTVNFSNNKNVHTVLNHMNLSIEEGEFVCVLGPSGCGKTTLLNCIAGFQKYEGKILLQDQLVSKPGKERGVMFQEYALFPWFTVEQNVAFGLKMSGMNKQQYLELARSFIRMVGLEGFEKHYPSRLSGGMKQRVSLARVLANNPSILLMDEPFAALDEQTRQHMQSELLKIWEQNKITCLFITHSIHEAIYLADRIIVLMPNPGRVALDIKVDLPRIRDRNDDRMFHYQKLISAILEGEVA
ncbi:MULTISPECIES: ABC transporter ATP-binding protein [Paenibacillus]|uniref:ABC transporter ATP-binding protein n=1 Tax=Paenibacillus TaxID=44249 RepID=UPI00203DB793|nr:ABC transporter ATP-binding protein [Paenibacillus camelliae]MCM3633849.1 ABC transporter ATP-binding protein [Paenibacillus camelliae]